MRPKLPIAELERRRRLAVARVQEGHSPQEVADFLGVHVRSVFRWLAAFRDQGRRGLRAIRHPGPEPKLTGRQEAQVRRWLRKPASDYGFPTELWTSKRLATLIQQRFGVAFNANYLCAWLRRRNFSPQKPRRVPRERDEEKVHAWLHEHWPSVLREAAQRQAHLVWIDESGYLLAPLLRRTWGVRGQTPVFRQRARHRDKVSAIAAFTLSPAGRRRGLYFQTYPKEYINNVKVAAFLRQLLRQVRGPVIVVWDGGNMHKGDPIRKILADYPRMRVERLPAYAPELNPVEHLWGFTKYGQLANYAAHDIASLHETVLERLRAAQRDPRRIARCFAASDINTSLVTATQPQLAMAA
jgi:transposase